MDAKGILYYSLYQFDDNIFLYNVIGFWARARTFRDAVSLLPMWEICWGNDKFADVWGAIYCDPREVTIAGVKAKIRKGSGTGLFFRKVRDAQSEKDGCEILKEEFWQGCGNVAKGKEKASREGVCSR